MTAYTSQAAYDFIVRSTADGILIMSSDQTIQHMNPAAAAILSVTLEDVIGKSPQMVFRKNQSLINLFMRTGEQKLDVRLPRQRLAQGIASTIVDENGHNLRIVVLQDVTEKRDIENRREMLSSTIAHDLRNPISAIGGFADLVTRFGDLNPQQTKYITRVRQTTTKIHEVVKSLVDLAWIEAGMPLAHVPIRFDEIIQDAVKAHASFAQKQEIGIAVSLQTPLPIVMGDPLRLQMVIMNLISNALMYSEAESNVVIHAWGDQNEIYCSVADRGIGIDDSELEMIFDRMYRSRDDRVREIAGGGLGLTVARTIIKRHGGDIWASSNLNLGSTFTFVLPAVEL
ncbi:MAG: ATP-binding protein [Phototrophicaceae bacterium]